MAELIGKLIGKFIATIINVVGVILVAPFAIIGGILGGFSRHKNMERNQQNGADIRALCTELGVPSDAYNRIVVSQMDEAKDVAMHIGQPGQRHQSTPWNTRLALAITAIYEDEKGQTQQVNDLVHGLQNYIANYEENNGHMPEAILLDHHVHLMFANAGVYRDQQKTFGGTKIIPTANIKDGLTWTAVDPVAEPEPVDDFDDDIPF